MIDARSTSSAAEPRAGSPSRLTAASSSHDGDAEPPIPPRFWWLKRLSLAAGVLLVALLGVRLWWGWVAESRFLAAIEQARAGGDPVTLEDFQRLARSIPDQRNAATYYLRAAAALPPRPTNAPSQAASASPGSASVSNASGREDLVGPEADLAPYAETLALVRAARDIPDRDWGIRFTRPVINVLPSHHSGQRDLAKVLADVATIQHQRGDDAAAVETLRDAVAHADAVGAGPSLLISVLTSVRCSELHAVNFGEQILAGIQVGAARDEQRRRVEALAVAWMDDRLVRSSMREAMLIERMLYIDSIDGFAQGAISLFGPPGATRMSALDRIVSPMYLLDGDYILVHSARQIAAAEAQTLARARALSPEYIARTGGFSRMSRVASHVLLPVLSNTYRGYYRGLAKRRLAAAALALRMYEADHDRPAVSLTDLVPDYLPELPIDPMAEDGRALGYLPADPPLRVYSIGLDAEDNRGAFEFTANGRLSEDAPDLVFFVNDDRQRGEAPSAAQPASNRTIGPNSANDPNAPPSTQAGEDQPDPEPDGW